MAKQQYKCGSIADIINETGSNTLKKKSKANKVDDISKYEKTDKKLESKKKTLKKKKMKNLFDEIVEENKGKLVDLPVANKNVQNELVKKIKQEMKSKDEIEDMSDLDEGLDYMDEDREEEEEEEEDDRGQRKRKKPMKDAPEKTERTIFVGNLPTTIDAKKLKQMFHQFGEIQSVRLRGAAPAKPKMPKKGAIITKQFHPGKDCIHGYVVFKSKEDSVKALTMNSYDLDGHHLRVDTLDSKHDQLSSIFIGNLPFAAKEEELRSFFSECGEIESVRIVRDNQSGMGKGFGFIAFKSKDSVILALEKNEEEFKGRKIRVNKAQAPANTNVKKNKPHRDSNVAVKQESKQESEEENKTVKKIKKKKVKAEPSSGGDENEKIDFKGKTVSKTHTLKAKKSKKKSLKQTLMKKKQKKIAEILSR